MIEQQPAYVLHSRPWREISLIADLFTLHSGRVSVVIKGARSGTTKQPAQRALIQPFTPLMISFGGRGELRTAHQIDAAGPPLSLSGTGLYSGFYVNELLLKLLALDDAHETLFAYYQALLDQLADNCGIEQSLRPFETHLMAELGYHIELDRDRGTGAAVTAERDYLFTPLEGVNLYLGGLRNGPLVSGKVLLALAQGDYSDPTNMKYAKYMARANIDQLLGGQPLHSRTLFQSISST